MDLVLVPLQTNQPPARSTHAQERGKTAENHSQDGMSKPTAWNNHHPQTTGRQDYKEDRQGQVKRPRVVLQMSAEDGEEAEDFDAEERQAEDVVCGWQAGGEDCAGHQGCVRGEGGGESGGVVSKVIVLQERGCRSHFASGPAP
jgi:hypothetical protein